MKSLQGAKGFQWQWFKVQTYLSRSPSLSFVSVASSKNSFRVLPYTDLQKGYKNQTWWKLLVYMSDTLTAYKISKNPPSSKFSDLNKGASCIQDYQWMNPICQLKQLHTLHIVNTTILALVLGKSSGKEQKGVIEAGIAQKNFAR